MTNVTSMKNEDCAKKINSLVSVIKAYNPGSEEAESNLIETAIVCRHFEVFEAIKTAWTTQDITKEDKQSISTALLNVLKEKNEARRSQGKF